MRSIHPVANLVLCALLLAMFAKFALADDGPVFESPKGFSVQYPADWKAEPKETATDAGRQGGFQMAVMIYPPNDVTVDFDVGIIPGLLPSNDAESVMRQSAQNGFNGVEDVVVDSETFGEKTATVARFTFSMRGPSHDPIRMRGMMAAIQGANQLYLVTGSAPDDQFSNYEPIFASMITNMKIDTGLAGVRRWVRLLVMGAVVLGVVVVLKKLLFKRNYAPPKSFRGPRTARY